MTLSKRTGPLKVKLFCHVYCFKREMDAMKTLGLFVMANSIFLFTKLSQA